MVTTDPAETDRVLEPAQSAVTTMARWTSDPVDVGLPHGKGQSSAECGPRRNSPFSGSPVTSNVGNFRPGVVVSEGPAALTSVILVANTHLYHSLRCRRCESPSLARDRCPWLHASTRPYCRRTLTEQPEGLTRQRRSSAIRL